MCHQRDGAVIRTVSGCMLWCECGLQLGGRGGGGGGGGGNLQTVQLDQETKGQTSMLIRSCLAHE